MKIQSLGTTLFSGLASAMLFTASVVYAAPDSSYEALISKTHMHGIAVHPVDPSRFYLATHHGFYLVAGDGKVTQMSDNQNDYMGFTPHPSNASVFFASGHPSTGGNTGFLQSTDQGRSWKRLSNGAGGPVDFHQMDVSQVNPDLIFGVFRGLQVSEDGGQSWQIVAKTPANLYDLAASPNDADTLYAATQQGLLISTDRGQSWSPAHMNQSPASMVQASADGSVYAFVAGLGLIRNSDDSMTWTSLNNDFGNRYLLHLAVNADYPDIIYTISNTKEVLHSGDGGRSWKLFDGTSGQ